MATTTMTLVVIDGTYELFRAFYGPMAGTSEVGAVRGLASSLLSLLKESSSSHVAIAFDSIIESFRNRLFDGYKTGVGIEPRLLGQFALAEEMTRALGLVTWSMVEFECDDALASAAHRYAEHSEVVIASPDKDLAQCVRGSHVIMRDRMRKTTMNEAGVIAKFGVTPKQIPDWLALVGDSADGIPGITGFGEKGAATVLQRYGHLDSIPASGWDVAIRGADKLAATLHAQREDALLYRTLATLRTDVPLNESFDALQWRGPTPLWSAMAMRLGDEGLVARADNIAAGRSQS
jgi:5'-3' exonuclease